jgi:hypothetical protein
MRRLNDRDRTVAELFLAHGSTPREIAATMARDVREIYESVARIKLKAKELLVTTAGLIVAPKNTLYTGIYPVEDFLAEKIDGDQTPMYLQAAQRLSELVGVPAERLLEDLPGNGSSYPLPECLLPDEVADYQRGYPLGPDRLLHAKSCKYCAPLLGAVAPDRNLERAFLEEVERLPETEPARPAVEPNRPWYQAFAAWPGPALAISMASAATAIVLCLVSAVTIDRYSREMAALREGRPVPAPLDPREIARDVAGQIQATLVSLPDDKSDDKSSAHRHGVDQALVDLKPLRDDINGTRTAFEEHSAELASLISQSRQPVDAAMIQAAVRAELKQPLEQLAAIQNHLKDLDTSVRASADLKQLLPLVEAAVNQAVQKEHGTLASAVGGYSMPNKSADMNVMRLWGSDPDSIHYKNFLSNHYLRAKALPGEANHKTTPDVLTLVDKADSSKQIVYLRANLPQPAASRDLKVTGKP